MLLFVHICSIPTFIWLQSHFIRQQKSAVFSTFTWCLNHQSFFCWVESKEYWDYSFTNIKGLRSWIMCLNAKRRVSIEISMKLVLILEKTRVVEIFDTVSLTWSMHVTNYIVIVKKLFEQCQNIFICLSLSNIDSNNNNKYV